MSENKHTIGGIDIELVKVATPVPHYRVKTLENDYLFEAGCFPGCKSRPKLVEELEYGFKRAGSVAEWRRRMGLPVEAPAKLAAAR